MQSFSYMIIPRNARMKGLYILTLRGLVIVLFSYSSSLRTTPGFKVGVTSIVIPYSNEQLAWAHRSYALGVGAKRKEKKELTSNKLANEYSLHNPIKSLQILKR